MLKAEINELLTQTGPETPAGDLFRRYWLPALHTEELPEDDCPPVRVKILSERLIAFRDSEGRYGLMDEFCAHRGVSLWFGRVEEGGLRCAYHGWKYDVTGQCLEVPSEPENSNFCEKVRLTAYPLVKVGDILWAYLGDPAKQPDLPEFEFVQVPPEQTYTSKRWQESNWLQALEGGIDSSHVSWLHSGGLKSDPLFKGTKGNEYNLNDLRPFFEVAEHDGGLFIGARRNAEEGRYYWRITPWVMPSFTIVPPRGDHPVHGHFWVPIDDENCWAYTFDYHPTRAPTPRTIASVPRRSSCRRPSRSSSRAARPWPCGPAWRTSACDRLDLELRASRDRRGGALSHRPADPGAVCSGDRTRPGGGGRRAPRRRAAVGRVAVLPGRSHVRHSGGSRRCGRRDHDRDRRRRRCDRGRDRACL